MKSIGAVNSAVAWAARVAVVTTVVWSMGAQVAQAGTPMYVRQSWTNPEATHTTHTVAWNTDAINDATLVEYGLDEAYGSTAEGSSALAKGDLGVVHEVEITGLQPDTTYHYRVGSPGAWSGDFTFHTAPEPDGCTPFRFIAMGDGRSDDDFGPSPHWNPILTESIEHDPHFIVLTGDQVRAGDVVDQWVNWLDATASGSAWIPLMPSLGNHDDDKVDGDDAIYNRIFALPANESSGTEDFYYFAYGNAVFVSLSMVTYQDDGFAQQAQWLDNVLTAHADKTWRVVFFHHPIYTGTLGIPGFLELNHPPNEVGQNPALVPIFDKHHVDLVLTGHNHHYQRFKPMCCGEGDDMGVPTGSPDTGTTYIITGGAGALTYDLEVLGLDIPGLLCLTPNSASCSGKHHYMVVDIDGLDMNVEVWSTAPQLLGSDVANIGIIDEFTISKSGPEPECGSGGEGDVGPGEDAGSTDVQEPDAAGSDAVGSDGAGSDAVGSDGSGSDAVGPDGAGKDIDIVQPPDDASGGPDANADGEGVDGASSDTGDAGGTSDVGGTRADTKTPNADSGAGWTPNKDSGATADTGTGSPNTPTTDSGSSDSGCRQTGGVPLMGLGLFALLGLGIRRRRS